MPDMNGIGLGIVRLTTTESSVLCAMWSSNRILCSTEIYEMMSRQAAKYKLDMPSPNALAICMRRMVEKGLLYVVTKPNNPKVYYQTVYDREKIKTALHADVEFWLTRSAGE